MFKFNPGLSLVLRKVFLSKDMQLELKKILLSLYPETRKVTLSNMYEGKLKNGTKL